VIYNFVPIGHRGLGPGSVTSHWIGLVNIHMQRSENCAKLSLLFVVPVGRSFNVEKFYSIFGMRDAQSLTELDGPVVRQCNRNWKIELAK